MQVMVSNAFFRNIKAVRIEAIGENRIVGVRKHAENSEVSLMMPLACAVAVAVMNGNIWK